jgi:pimeloyl-ACP methyl ester carboxylesterase
MGREGLPQFGFPRLDFALGRTLGLAIAPDHTPQLRITTNYVPSDLNHLRDTVPLAKPFTVVAVDLRGIGGSTPPSDGYDAANMAGDIYHLASVLKLEHVYIVGHDIGGHVAYAFVRRFPQITRGVMVLDTPIRNGPDSWRRTLCGRGSTGTGRRAN